MEIVDGVVAGRLLHGRGGDYLIFAGVPAWVLAGVTLKLVTDTAALAEPCNVAATAAPRARARMARPRLIPTSM